MSFSPTAQHSVVEGQEIPAMLPIPDISVAALHPVLGVHSVATPSVKLEFSPTDQHRLVEGQEMALR
jgi:hypothetical protein